MRRRFGQHLLIDENVVNREIKYAEISSDDVILEVGPGKGILTKLLAEKAKKVIAVEIDKDFVEYLNDMLSENVEVIHADVLKIDFFKLTPFNKVVANLPFKISSPFTFKLLRYPSFSKAVMIYQKEFAERMVAEPHSKKYSRLTVAVYYKSYCRILETVPKSAFRPMPKVDAAIVEVTPRKKPPFPVLNEKLFFSLTNLLFSQRRKHIGGVIMKKYGVHVPFSDKRVEELTPEEIGEISNVIAEVLQSREKLFN